MIWSILWELFRELLLHIGVGSSSVLLEICSHWFFVWAIRIKPHYKTSCSRFYLEKGTFNVRSIYCWVQTLELLKTETDNKFPNTSSWIKSSQSGHCATVFWFETRESRNFWTLRQISSRLWFHLSKERFYTNSFVIWDSISQSCWRNYTCTIYNVCYCKNKPRISVNVVFIVHSGSNSNAFYLYIVGWQVWA